MPKQSNRTGSRKHSSTRPKTGRKTRSKTTTRKSGRSAHGAQTDVHRKSLRNATGITYVFECTRQGCGYQIVREEKADTGKLRFDLKCPKCHNREFKCLGPGDLPMPELDMTIQAPEIDFDNAGPVKIGSS